MSPVSPPTLRFERGLLREGHTLLACVDEVGRGALSGPVTLGVVVIDLTTRTAPRGVRDSKLLTPEARVRLAPKIRRWAVAHGVGHASAAEIDALGLMAAMRLAGQRALAQSGAVPDLVLLDGNHDYLTPPAQLELLDVEPVEWGPIPPVRTAIKADMKCAGVAAASILAKTERDALMVALHEECPHYDWVRNKGYSAPEHLAALSTYGASVHHRRSWSLPGIMVGQPTQQIEENA